MHLIILIIKQAVAHLKIILKARRRSDTVIHILRFLRPQKERE